MADHQLIEIHRDRSRDGMADTVVRWCENCGAIVVDGEFDGRVHPGRYRSMTRPAVSKPKGPCDG